MFRVTLKKRSKLINCMAFAFRDKTFRHTTFPEKLSSCQNTLNTNKFKHFLFYCLILREKSTLMPSASAHSEKMRNKPPLFTYNPIFSLHPSPLPQSLPIRHKNKHQLLENNGNQLHPPVSIETRPQLNQPLRLPLRNCGPGQILIPFRAVPELQPGTRNGLRGIRQP